ncbi:hypothetical protein EG68_09598 [Paragonimus skrjabini miyazakii]|uniref:Uncharacterized protein n=1 Tax=Paragonimus skrjabini miyazakii TaxID=59628 RepID=A0A8S9YHU3_9TREM|nr:hypothetical protein EG68_09598 [Paragonimus skrjabini miyazakii]
MLQTYLKVHVQGKNDWQRNTCGVNLFSGALFHTKTS